MRTGWFRSIEVQVASERGSRRAPARVAKERILEEFLRVTGELPTTEADVNGNAGCCETMMVERVSALDGVHSDA